MRALALLLLLMLPRPAEAWCLLACDEVTRGPGAKARAEATLGLALPPEAKVVGLVEGGFQDRFVQARIEVPDARLDAALGAFGLARAGLRPAADEGFGPSDHAWFDAESRPGMLVGAPALRGFAYATLGVAPDGDGAAWTLYLWAFQT